MLSLIKTDRKMYKSEDFERFFLRYKAEAYPSGESIQSFCIRKIGDVIIGLLPLTYALIEEKEY